jgi:asparagine synthase (glutamine-hydrolysing)
MSGICAVWRKENAGPVAEILTLVSGGLSPHRSETVTARSDGAAGLAVSSAFATQQFHEDARVIVVSDAELYNQKELENLAGTGPASGSAALIGRLYERLGTDLFEKLRGAFSVILWDRRERRLLASTDGFGIQRLAYCEDCRLLLISSRADSIVRYDGVDQTINPRAIANVLNFSSNLAPETIFQKVRRLSPGTTLIAADRTVRTGKYWDMRYGVGDDANEGRLSRQLEETVECAVRTSVGEEPFEQTGAFLSGGTDSSTVVGMMSRMTGGSKAFSIGFQEQAFDELGYARIAAERFQAQHYTYLVGPDDCFEALPHIIRSFDEPYGNSSAIPTYFCARLAAENGVKTLLAGDGGDELFGGNSRYQSDKVFQVYQNVPRWLRKGLMEPALRVLPIQAGVFRRARNYIARSNMPAIDRYLSYQFLCTHPYTEVFEPGFINSLEGYTIADIPARHYAGAPARDHLDRLLYVDVKITLADNDLPKVTCMSELAGIRTRFPFLDRQVAELSGRIPANLKVKGFEKRYLFKKAFRNLLPIEIIRKTKHGFGIPVGLWLKTDRRLREMALDTLSASRARSRGYFKRQFIDELLRKHEGEEGTYYGDSVWTFFVMELWHRQVVDELAGVRA